LLGKGAQGEVKKVKCLRSGKECAMKVVNAQKMKNSKYAEQIIYETLLLNNLKHENIIKVTDFFKLKSGKFVSVMEYQDSYDLEKIVNEPETVMEEN